MKSAVVLGLLGASLPALAHPEPASTYSPEVRKRLVDLNAFRITQNAEYLNQGAASTNEAMLVSKRETYVETATAVLESTVPGATFRLVQDHYVGNNGIAHVNFKQTVHGIDIDNADFNVNIAKDGSVFSYGNSFYTGEIPAENPLHKRAFSDPASAFHGANSMLSLGLSGQPTAEAVEGVETYKLKGVSGAEKVPEARLVYFAKPDNSLSLTWRVETDLLDNWLLSYVDATTNEQVHGVVDWVASATFEVYPWGVNDPDVGSRVTLEDPWDLSDSPFTWLSDGTTDYDVTRGNNAIAQTNPSGGTSYLNNYRPASSTDDFDYDWSVKWSPPSVYANASVTQLFYTANTYHDVLYDLGFTEAAGNFEANNDGKGGVAGDYVILNAQDGSGTNNANFATPTDGQMGRMRMYIWTYSTPYRDCAFEAGVIIHEYTHGVSNRLTGGPQNVNCLQTTEAGGMGEGWGDFMATAIRLQPNDTRETDYPIGAWVYNNPAGIRAYLYSTSTTTNPQTYTTANTLNEVHAIGTIWANILYEAMWNLIDKHGLSTAQKPEFDADGVPTDGKFLTMKLVIDGMALQPCNPNMPQARDAILDADTALTGGDNQCELWTAFAKRGLGSGAKFGTTRTGSTTIPAGVC
ncbi:extracellular elastinolytic metallo proteinase [Xylariaceae sp. FL1019]|nr:extracellular elastinolytic metallo proteinase [Xylariaceae sp. FL1019]